MTLQPASGSTFDAPSALSLVQLAAPTAGVDLRVVSFGTVHGEPLPTFDLVANAERFRDPGISEELRYKNGFDHHEVIDHVLSTPGVVDFIDGLYEATVRLLWMGGPTVVVVVVCVGGRHRSPVIANELGKLVEGDWSVRVEHPHLNRPVIRRDTAPRRARLDVAVAATGLAASAIYEPVTDVVAEPPVPGCGIEELGPS